MHRALLMLLFGLPVLGSCVHSRPLPEEPESGAAIELDGERLSVRWSDGDSFKFLSGPYKGSGVRLTGYNTLESYGPVHRWGDWTGGELYEIARSSKDLAGAHVWRCTSDGDRDGYGRVLVDCPGVAAHLVDMGHAHVFSMEGEGPDELLRLQRRAQRKGRGIWRRGVPEALVTSLHSDDEGSKQAYNRVVDTQTGLSSVREHSDVYGICQEVCEGAPGSGSCMTYVPFRLRYRDKPDCLR